MDDRSPGGRAIDNTPGASSSGELARLAESANEKLDLLGQSRATQAFNLGCSLTLLPGMLLLAVVLIVTRLNWIAAAITLTLVLLAAVGFANLAAITTRTRSVERSFQSDVRLEIERELRRQQASWPQLAQIARQTLPENAPLLAFLDLPATNEGNPDVQP